MTGLHKRHLVLISLALAIFWMIGCGGGSSSTVTSVLTDTSDPPGIINPLEGENGSGGNGSGDNGAVDGGTTSPTNPNLQPIQGQLGSAPLGTNPKYNVQEAESLIVTRKINSTTSSVDRSASEVINQVVGLSVVAHGDEYIENGAGGPFEEGTKIDLYIHYKVLPGQLTLTRTWFISACSLNFSDEYTHPSAGEYEAILPFIIPYGSAPLQAVFKGIISGPKTVSVIPVADYLGYGEVPFEILYVPIFPPNYFPDADAGDGGGPHPCMPDWGSISVYSDLHVESTDKGIGAVVYIFDPDLTVLGDEVAYKFPGISGGAFDPFKENPGQGHPFPPINPLTGDPFLITDCTIVFVSAGCNYSGYGPGWGWRFDAPFPEPGEGPDTNQVPTAQLLVEESEPAFAGDTTVDYDYNDFVGTFRAVEMYKDPPGVSNNEGLLVQIEMTVYAQACSVEEPMQWQLNVDCDMPLGTQVQAIVQLYNEESDLPYYSDQMLYYSESGFSVPVLVKLLNSLAYPSGYDSVNCDPWNFPKLVNGDWADVTITLLEPAGTGGYDPWPYVPVMWIGLPDETYGYEAYSIGFWKELDDPLNADGMPQAILMPDTFAWPLEGVIISDVYAGFDEWIEYINDPTKYPPLYNWYDGNPYTGEDPDLSSTWKAFSEDKFQQ
jgi:hypothetical protein